MQAAWSDIAWNYAKAGIKAVGMKCAIAFSKLPQLEHMSQQEIRGQLWRSAYKDSWSVDAYTRLLNRSAGAKKPYSNNSGKMLRSYLWGKIDPALAMENGEEMRQSADFEQLRKWVQLSLQKLVDLHARSGRVPDVHHMKQHVQQYLDRRRRRYGIVFTGHLNPIIGGVTDVRVRTVKRLGHNAGGSKSQSEYEVSLTFFDTYDFDNDRSQLPVYDGFRKRLTTLLRNQKYRDFVDEYNHAIEHEQVNGQPLSRSQVFASLMYALEMNNVTRGGLSWNVNIPMKVTLRIR